MTCDSVHKETGRTCKLPLHHQGEGLTFHQAGSVRWRQGTNGQTTVEPAKPDDTFIRFHDRIVYHPEDVWIVRDGNGTIVGYMVEVPR